MFTNHRYLKVVKLSKLPSVTQIYEYLSNCAKKAAPYRGTSKHTDIIPTIDKMRVGEVSLDEMS